MIKSLLFSRSYKKGIALSTLLVFVSKGIGFLNVVVIASFFGTTASTDIFFFCTAIIGTFSAFLTALNASILIPEAMRIKERRSEKESQEFLSFFLYLYIGICVALSAAAVADPIQTFSLVSKFKADILGENVIILYCAIPLLVLMTINVFFSDVLSSYKYFSLPVAATLLNSTVSILTVLVFHRHLHVLSALFGVLAANVVQCAASVYLLKKHCSWSFGFRRVPLGRKLISDGILAQAGNFSHMLTSYIPMMLLSMFPAGVLSALTYGAKLPEVLTLLFILQFGAVAGIKLNELYAQKRESEIRRTFMDASAFLQFILIPLCIFISLFSSDLITVLFGRGAFDRHAIEQTARFMSVSVLALPFVAHNAMVGRLFMAAQKIKQGVPFQIIMSCVHVLIVTAFIKTAGPIGFPLGMLVFYIINTIAAATIMKRNFVAIPYGRSIAYTAKCLLMNAPVAAVVYGAARALPLQAPWLAAVFFIVYLSMLLAINQLFKVNGIVAGYVGRCSGRMVRARSA